MTSSFKAGRSVVLATLLYAFAPTFIAAQATATVRAAENLRKDANGEVLARLEPGAALRVVGRRDSWVEVDLEGWVWARSLQVVDREGLDLIVSEPEGENIREAPSGTVMGKLGRGTLLEELERRPGWIRARRRAWIWGASITEKAPPAASGRPVAPSGATAAPSSAPPRTAGGMSPPHAAAGRPPAFMTAGAAGAPVLAAPGGDTIGRASPRAELEIVAREGSWARVRLEGWTWLPPRDTAGAIAGEAAGTLTPAELRSDPAAHRGRMVVWELQFISLEKAEKVRTDFFEGEPFLLTRFGGSEGPFVYVAVPGDRVREFEGLVPLERLVVTGRVRTGASSLTGTPIIDLVTLARSRNPG